MTFVQLLYGSRARGEADDLSDTDVLLVDDSPEGDYRWGEIEHLRSYGSLFLWHLILEAKELDADDAGRARWADIATEIPRYRRAIADLDAFEVVLSDVAESLEFDDAEAPFEAAVLARTVRHAAILGCFLKGSPNFSRYGAVRQALEQFGLATPRGVSFERLYDLVLGADGEIDAVDVRAWVDTGVALVARMRESEGADNGAA